MTVADKIRALDTGWNGDFGECLFGVENPEALRDALADALDALEASPCYCQRIGSATASAAGVVIGPVHVTKCARCKAVGRVREQLGGEK